MSAELCGVPTVLEPDRAVVELETRPEMRADAYGLVHGGFVFGLADYAAMLAINHPNVVLGGAEVRLLAPVAVGDRLCAMAQRVRSEGKKHFVEVEVRCGEKSVLRGSFVCFVPSAHVLAPRERGSAGEPVDDARGSADDDVAPEPGPQEDG
jgi:acyl-coenzyme A thioesterase PaaI-like protein